MVGKVSSSKIKRSNILGSSYIIILGRNMKHVNVTAVIILEIICVIILKRKWVVNMPNVKILCHIYML